MVWNYKREIIKYWIATAILAILAITLSTLLNVVTLTENDLKIIGIFIYMKNIWVCAGLVVGTVLVRIVGFKTRYL
jgi:hypothetical protein